jgi:transposase
VPAPDVHAGDRCGRGIRPSSSERWRTTVSSFRSALDDPARFGSSKKVGPWAGPTPARNQSGERDVSGHITEAGDAGLRRARCQAAAVLMNRGPSTWLRTRAARAARRRGRKRAMVALARRIAVVLHRVRRDGTRCLAEAPVGRAA